MINPAEKIIIIMYADWQGVGGINNKVSHPHRRATLYIN